MSKFFGIILSLLLLGGFSARVFPEETKEKKASPVKYTSETSLSLVLVKGNNDYLSFSLDTEQNLNILKHRIGFKGRFITARAKDRGRSDIHYAHLKYDHRIRSRSWLLGYLRYESNKQAGNNFRLAISGGGGITWLKGARSEFLSELAVGWNNEESTKRVNMDNVGNTVWQKTITSSFVSTILNNKLILNVTETARVVFRGTMFVNAEYWDDYRLSGYGAIYAAISPKLALKTSLEILYENIPVPGFRPTDFFLLSSLVIKI